MSDELKPCPFCGFSSRCLTRVTAGAGMLDALLSRGGPETGERT